MARKQKTDYFEILAQLAEYTSKSARMLEEIVRTYDPDHIGDFLEQMHEIEHSADIAHHELMEKLSHEFLTPIEREDIAALGNMIDEVTDSIEDIVLRFYMFDVRSLRPEALVFAEIIIKQDAELVRLMKELHAFRQSAQIRKCIVEINRLEEEGDRTYYAAIRRLYTDESDTREVLKWTEIFRRMEACCDNVEDVSQLVENIIMKNS